MFFLIIKKHYIYFKKRLAMDVKLRLVNSLIHPYISFGFITQSNSTKLQFMRNSCVAYKINFRKHIPSNLHKAEEVNIKRRIEYCTLIFLRKLLRVIRGEFILCGFYIFDQVFYLFRSIY